MGEITEILKTEPEPTITSEISPTTTPTQLATKTPYAPSPDMVAVKVFGIRFSYPTQYSSGYSQAMIPENEVGIFGDIYPDRIEITLKN